MPSAQAQSPDPLRTGPEIDAYERLYFGLFPDIANFERASVRTLPDGAMEFVIARTGVSDTTLRLNPSYADTLRARLRDYDTRAFGGTWDDLLTEAGYILPHAVKTDDEYIVIISPADDAARPMRLLAVLDTTLIVQDHPSAATGVVLASVLRHAEMAMPLSALGTATRVCTASNWPGALIGAAIGTAVVFPFMFQEFTTNKKYKFSVEGPSDLLGPLILSALIGVPVGMLAGAYIAYNRHKDAPIPLRDAVRTRLALIKALPHACPPTPRLRRTLDARAAHAADSLALRTFNEIRARRSR